MGTDTHETDTHETDTHSMARAKAIKLLGDKIKGIKVAMLTTVNPDGTVHCRPMAALGMEPDGDLWFFTYADASKVGEVLHDQQVNLAYVKADDNRFVSISGTAQLVRERATIERFWKPFMQAWFPNGKDDPNLALLRVRVHHAQFWDGPSTFVGEALVLAKDLITGSHSAGGMNEQIDVQ
jgi:general stress protein 26